MQLTSFLVINKTLKYRVISFTMNMSQSPHHMQLPREVIVGWGILDRVGNICKQLGLSSPALVLTGSHTYDIAGKKVISSLENQGYKTDFLLVKESTIRQVIEAIETIKSYNPNIILGVGGGKVIDVAKFSSYKVDIPFISVPTAASHDGIASDSSSISDSEKPVSIRVKAPLGIIADTEIVSQSPNRLTTSGCGDIIAKYTAVRDWELAHELKNEYYGEYASNLALMSAKLIMKNAKIISQNKEEGLRIVLEALLSCGVAMNIAGSSRPCSGSEHLFSHALNIVSNKAALHGEQCGIGTIMMAYLQKKNWRMVREKLKTIGAPVTAKELGIKPSHIIEALTIAHTIRPERYTILGRDGLTRDAAEDLAKAVDVID